MLDKLRLGSVLGALVMFFLPWVEMRCSGERFLTQTGVQTVYGGASLAAEMPGDEKAEQEKESLGHAVMVGAALLLVVVAGIASLMAFRGSKSARNFAGACCAGALALLLVQASVGFPLKNEMRESMEEDGAPDDPEDALGAGMAAAMMANIRIGLLPAFYIELALLGLPVLITGNSLLDRMKKPEG